MDDEEGGGDVASIMTYGALALFDETVAFRDITCAPKMNRSCRLLMFFRLGPGSRQVNRKDRDRENVARGDK